MCTCDRKQEHWHLSSSSRHLSVSVAWLNTFTLVHLRQKHQRFESSGTSNIFDHNIAQLQVPMMQHDYKTKSIMHALSNSTSIASHQSAVWQFICKPFSAHLAKPQKCEPSISMGFNHTHPLPYYIYLGLRPSSMCCNNRQTPSLAQESKHFPHEKRQQQCRSAETIGCAVSNHHTVQIAVDTAFKARHQLNCDTVHSERGTTGAKYNP